MYIQKILKITKSLKTLILLLLVIPSFAIADQYSKSGSAKDNYQIWEDKGYYNNKFSNDYNDKADYEDKYYHNKHWSDHDREKKWKEHIKEARSHFRMRLRELLRYIHRVTAALKDPDTDWDNFNWGWYKDDDSSDDSTDDDSTGDDSTGDDSTGDDSTEDDSTGDDSLSDNSLLQSVSVSNQPFGLLGENVDFDIVYIASDDNNQLSGLGLRVHFDSSILTLNSVSDILQQDIIVSGEGPLADAEDFDNDPQTNSYITFGWASLFNNWPNTAFPSVLAKISFGVSGAIDTEAISSTAVNFSGITTAAGYEFDSQSYVLELSEDETTWDFDGNGDADALTDGLIMMRYSFGLRGDSMANNAMASDSQMSVSQVEERLTGAMKIADIDDDGYVDALTDGLLLLRHLFAMDDESFSHGAVAHSASRKTKHALKHHLNKYMPKKKQDK